MSWQWVSVIAVTFPILVIPGLIFLSDSPYWYLQQGQDKKALKVMERFRSSDANVLAELLAISDSLRRPEDFQDLTYKDMFEQMFFQRQYRRPFIILNVLFILMIFSGKFAISFYAVEIFHQSSGHVNEYISAIIVGKDVFIKQPLHMSLSFWYPHQVSSNWWEVFCTFPPLRNLAVEHCCVARPWSWARP